MGSSFSTTLLKRLIGDFGFLLLVSQRKKKRKEASSEAQNHERAEAK